MKITKRPNPAVAVSERRAKAAEDMAEMVARDFPNMSSAVQRMANRRRATADKIRKERPYLIAREN